MAQQARSSDGRACIQVRHAAVVRAVTRIPVKPKLAAVGDVEGAGVGKCFRPTQLDIQMGGLAVHGARVDHVTGNGSRTAAAIGINALECRARLVGECSSNR